MRSWLGPVFTYECLILSRRWQTYAVRAFAVCVLLATMAAIAWSNDSLSASRSMSEFAVLGQSYSRGLLGVELALVLLAAPAATAGAICLDRSRGTLAHLLATDLSDVEIVLGKLTARLLPVLGLVGCTWPVLAITTLLGGVDPWRLMAGFAVILASALLGCGLALLLSVWARRPHEVVLTIYAVWICLILLSTIWTGLAATGLVSGPPRWADRANPFYVALAPLTDPSLVRFWDYLGFFAATLGASVIFVVLAIWRMRPVARRSGGARGVVGLGWLGRMGRWLPGPSLDGNPVLWREWHRSRPSFWMVCLFLLVGGSTSVCCGVPAYAAWKHGVARLTIPSAALIAGIFGAIVQVFVGLLMISAVAPMSMSEEQERGSFDLLAVTPLSARTIVLGKWWGTFRMVLWLAIGPGIMAFVFATAKEPAPLAAPPGAPAVFFPPPISLPYRLIAATLLVATILAHGAAMTSIGLALAIWIKRQSRAIAVSVALFVFLAIGWPFVVVVLTGGSTESDRVGMAALSPVFYTVRSTALLFERQDRDRFLLTWAATWVFQMVLVAVGVRWLAVQTFDRSVGRVAEQMQLSAVWHWVAAIAVTCIAVAHARWGFDRILALMHDYEETTRVYGFSMLAMIELIGLFLVGALAASFRSRERAPGSFERIDA